MFRNTKKGFVGGGGEGRRGFTILRYFSSYKHMSGLDDQIHCGSGTVIAGASIAKKPETERFERD